MEDTGRHVNWHTIEAALEDFRSVRRRTIEMMTPLSQGQLDWPPSERKWSAGEVLDHLVLVEATHQANIGELIELQRNGERTVLKRTFSDINTAPPLIPKQILPMFDVPFTLFTMMMPRKIHSMLMQYQIIPFQAADSITPVKGKAASELKHALESSIRRTASILESNSDLDFTLLVLKHPALGANNVGQLLGVMANHERRHQTQIEDILRRFQKKS